MIYTAAITGKPLGFQKLTVDDTARALTVPLNTTTIVMVLETDTIRWRDDGTNPTSATGMPLYANQSMVLDNAASIAAFRAIRVNTTATLNISYYQIL